MPVKLASQRIAVPPDTPGSQDTWLRASQPMQLAGPNSSRAHLHVEDPGEHVVNSYRRPATTANWYQAQSLALPSALEWVA